MIEKTGMRTRLWKKNRMKGEEKKNGKEIIGKIFVCGVNVQIHTNKIRSNCEGGHIDWSVNGRPSLTEFFLYNICNSINFEFVLFRFRNE